MRGPLIGWKDFQLPLDKETSSRRGLGGVPRGEEEYLVFWEKTKEKNGNVRKILVFKYGKVLFMKKMCATKSMEGVVCSST
jgi:hypothetical protein